jgi:hypothetical protein
MIIKLVRFLFSLMFVVLIVDPTDRIFHSKIPVFILLFVVWLYLKITYKIRYRKDIIWVPIILIAIAIFGTAVAVLQNDDIDFNVSLTFIKALLLLFLIIIVIDLNLYPDNYLNRYSIIIPLITIPIYIISFFNPPSFVTLFNYFVLEKEAAMMAVRNFYGYNLVMIYYKTSPILVFPLAYYCQQLIRGHAKFKNVFFVLLYAWCLIISGTRANILSVFIVLMFFLYFYLKKRKNAYYSLFAILAVFSLLTVFIYSLSFEEKEASAGVKSGHLKSTYQTFQDNPEYLLWGQGLGSKFYSLGNNRYVSHTELTYLELIRYFGVPLFLLFFILLIYPLVHIIRHKKFNNTNIYLLPAFLSYLFIAGTNPLLVSSTGMIIIIVMYSFMSRNNAQQQF